MAFSLVQEFEEALHEARKVPDEVRGIENPSSVWRFHYREEKKHPFPLEGKDKEKAAKKNVTSETCKYEQCKAQHIPTGEKTKVQREGYGKLHKSVTR